MFNLHSLKRHQNPKQRVGSRFLSRDPDSPTGYYSLTSESQRPVLTWTFRMTTLYGTQSIVGLAECREANRLFAPGRGMSEHRDDHRRMLEQAQSGSDDATGELMLFIRAVRRRLN